MLIDDEKKLIYEIKPVSDLHMLACCCFYPILWCCNLNDKYSISCNEGDFIIRYWKIISKGKYIPCFQYDKYFDYNGQRNEYDR